jgi:alpha-L-fucosidase 2
VKQLLSIFFFFVSVAGLSQNKASLKLWYKQPSGNTWENALPIGNGKLGAMVYGNVEKETIQLNEHTVWSGSPNRNDNLLASDSLASIRKLIFDGKQKEAEQMANRIILSKKSHGQMFQPVGNFHLSFIGHDNYTNYYRELDIEKAIAKTSYTVGDITYTREVLTSFPDHVIVMHLTASKPHNISFKASFTTPQPKATIETTDLKQLVIKGTTIDHEGVPGMIKFKGIVQIKPEGGNLIVTDTSIILNNADAATIYISIATNLNNYKDLNGNEDERANTYLKKASQKNLC